MATTLTLTALTVGAAATGVTGSAAPSSTESSTDNFTDNSTGRFPETGADAWAAVSVTLVQRVEREVTLEPLPVERDQKGADLVRASALGSFDVPEAALRAYQRAAAAANTSNPGCALPWSLLAGIGRVESDHGRYGGSVLGADGKPRPAIVGIALDGVGPVAAIRDSDDGRFDGDTVWDRAVGPMQFIPTTWATAGRDGDGDGVKDPHDLDDAALAAAAYLCPTSGSIRADGAMEQAVFSYNHSDYYVDLVLAYEAGYRTGTFTIPSPPPPKAPTSSTAASPAPKPGPTKAAPSATPATKPATKLKPVIKPVTKPATKLKPVIKPVTKPVKSPSKSPVKPSDRPVNPTPTPTTTTPGGSPTPSAPAYITVTGVLTHADGRFLLDGVLLDLGTDEELDAKAKHDHDRDGLLESDRDELLGLVQEGKPVTVAHQAGTTPLRVTMLQDEPFRA